MQQQQQHQLIPNARQQLLPFWTKQQSGAGVDLLLLGMVQPWYEAAAGVVLTSPLESCLGIPLNEQTCRGTVESSDKEAMNGTGKPLAFSLLML